MKETTQNDLEHQKIENTIIGLRAQFESNFDTIGAQLEMIKENTIETLGQTKLTNGRVNKLEEKIQSFESEIDTIRFFKKHKFIFGLLVLGVFYAYEHFDLEKIINKILQWI